jgi:hypothetical protein
MAALTPQELRFPTFNGKRGNCDVLVVGATPSGIAAALAAARRGADVVLVEERPHVGGDVVYAMLNMFDIPARPGETAPLHGIFGEFYAQLGMGFDIRHAQQLFAASLVAEPTIRTFVSTRVSRVEKMGDRVTGVVLQAKGPSGPVEAPMQAKVVIDATNDASFAARAGAGYYLGREIANPDKRMQSASLLFSVSGVDWNAVRVYVRGKRLMRAGALTAQEFTPDAAPTTSKRLVQTARQTPDKKVWLRLGGAHEDYAWERGDVVRGYTPKGENILFLSINCGRQSDGTVVLNTLNLVGVNGLDPTSVRHAYAEAKREMPHFIRYLRYRMPGFKDAQLAQVAPELYIRETRHIHGYYALKTDDIRRETRFFDRVAQVSYPLDLHPYTKSQHNPFGPRRYYYTLPLRSLVPRKVNNVFVASRSLSATYSAAGSARVVPVTMAAGEAAGTAAWLCTRRNITPHDMMDNSKWVRLVQDSLREWGVDIGDDHPQNSSSSRMSESGV